MTNNESPPLSVPGPDDILRHEFDNGIVALVRENHTSPAVVVAGYLQVGAIDVPAEQAGLSSFTAAALMRGTQKRTFAQIYEEIESVGATASFSGGGHTTSFGAKSLAEDLPLILDILAESIQRPTFPEKEVKRLRGQILTSLQERANNTRAMASLAFRELAYPNGHPYGRSARGYPETIRGLTRDDLVRFYQQGYGAQGMTLCIVGAVQADDALAQIEAAFTDPAGSTGSDWRGRTFSRPPLPPVSRPERMVRKQVDMPNKIQTDIVMGLPGPARAEPDYLDAALANTILGVFGMMGRLGQHLRDEQGLAYYVYSQLDGGLGPGPWTVVAGVDPTNVERVIESARSEIRCLRDTLVEAEELADVKTYITGSLPLRLEANEGVAGAILNMEQYGLGLDYLIRYSDLINGITAERVQAAARKWLDPDNMAIGIAGPPAESVGMQTFVSLSRTMHAD
jgi:zinc protease